MYLENKEIRSDIAYHESDIEIRKWRNKRKKGKGKIVATVVLTKEGQIFANYTKEKYKKHHLIQYQVNVAKALLEARKGEE